MENSEAALDCCHCEMSTFLGQGPIFIFIFIGFDIMGGSIERTVVR